MGPVLIFDKSTLQSLSVDESVWLGAFYLTNITPLFFVETLADLKKQIDDGRTPEQIVGNLAEKTPIGSNPNVFHAEICLGELLGHSIEMRGVPAIAGGKSFVSGGRRGLMYEEPPEMTALRRWQRHQFLEIERDFAGTWRQAVSNLDLVEARHRGQAIIARHSRPRDLAEARALAGSLLGRRGSRYAREALAGFHFSAAAVREILERWRRGGEPPITDYAPYTAHVITVDLFFDIGLGADLISADRRSNKIDIAYLYYLPFCMVFTSNDGLHARTAKLFMPGERQEFVLGRELKEDLGRLDVHYSALPDEIKEQGVMKFAHYPPTTSDFLAARLWDKCMRPDWREIAMKPEQPMSEESEKKLVAEMNRMVRAGRAQSAAPRVGMDEADATIFEELVPARKGKWRMVPPEVEAAGPDA